MMYQIDPEMPVAVILPAVEWLVITLELSKTIDEIHARCQIPGVCVSCRTIAQGLTDATETIMDTVGAVAEVTNSAH